MKKNVFQGFEGLVLDNQAAIKGGIDYRTTTDRSGSQVDEEAVTAGGEYDPWTGTTPSYQSIDQRWETCTG